MPQFSAPPRPPLLLLLSLLRLAAAPVTLVWDIDKWSFLQGEAPDTVNPSLWRQSQLASIAGLFEVVEGVFTSEQKTEMIERVTDVMVGIEGEAMRGVTWVRVKEVASGEWGIGGRALTAVDMHQMARAGQ